MTAFKDGHSIETSMGYSPLAGLVMSTRSGDIDAVIVLELIRHGYDADHIDNILNHESGLIGLSRCSSNLAEVIDESERATRIAELQQRCMPIDSSSTLVDITGR